MNDVFISRNRTCALLCALVLFSSSCTTNRVELNNRFAFGASDEWEITNPVTRTDWLASTPGETVTSNAEIEGYASSDSVNIGENIQFFVNSREPYKIEFYRMGWYYGKGAAKMRTELFRTTPNIQPPCRHFNNTHRIECNWRQAQSLNIPESWVSGVYLAKLITRESNKQSFIIFVVRDDDRSADYLFQTSVTTYQAYNLWGGYSLYPHRGRIKATEVSFDRPYDQGYGTEGHEGAGDFFRWEINLLRWMEKEGYDVTYATNTDIHNNPNLLENRKAFISVGHDEYWTPEMRANLSSAQNQCTNLGFFSANSIYWRSKLRANSRGQANRTLATSKSCSGDGSESEWRDNCGGRIAAEPEDAIIGVLWEEPIHVDSDLIVTNTDHWIYDFTELEDGDRLVGLVGYEADRLGNATPDNLTVLAESPTCPSICTQPRRGGSCDRAPIPACSCGSSVSGESNMSFYETENGAAVFATGTIQWAWGLDDYESPQDSTPHCSRVQRDVQQITRNVLKRLKQTSCVSTR
jgi:hypothetical protein